MEQMMQITKITVSKVCAEYRKKEPKVNIWNVFWFYYKKMLGAVGSNKVSESTIHYAFF